MSELCPSGRSEGYEIRDDEAPRPRGSREPRHGRHVLSNKLSKPHGPMLWGFFIQRGRNLPLFPSKNYLGRQPIDRRS